MVLLIDNYDSFTYNLVDYFARIGVNCTVLRNQEETLAEQATRAKAIIISPGPETPKKAGLLLQVLALELIRKPMLGICLGHQALGQLTGAKLVKAAKPMHGKLSEIHCDDPVMFREIPARHQVVRYHSLILENLPAEWRVTARTESGEIMAMRHAVLPLWGVQYHPEAWLTAHGLRLLQNFAETYQLYA
jgi:anthranilate synthase component 2